MYYLQSTFMYAHEYLCVYIFISSASATLNNNDMATANLNGLVCEEMYSIIAGGVITNVAMMDQTLVGPRFHMETITAPACPVGIQTTSVSTGKICS